MYILYNLWSTDLRNVTAFDFNNIVLNLIFYVLCPYKLWSERVNWFVLSPFWLLGRLCYSLQYGCVLVSKWISCLFFCCMITLIVTILLPFIIILLRIHIRFTTMIYCNAIILRATFPWCAPLRNVRHGGDSKRFRTTRILIYGQILHKYTLAICYYYNTLWARHFTCVEEPYI